MLARPSRFRELESFYWLAWTIVTSTTLSFGLMMGVSLSPKEVTPAGSWLAYIGALVVLVGVPVLAKILHTRHLRRESTASAEARAALGARLLRKVPQWETAVAEVLGGRRVVLTIRPDDASVMWTARSAEPDPEIVLTTGFWTSAGARPEEMRAALVHEAGHVAARDVEVFHRLLATVKAIAIVAATAFSLRIMLYLIRGQAEKIESLAYLFTELLWGLVGVFACWSALVQAREIQADAFAADLLGPGTVGDFLRDRLALRRNERLGVRARIWRAFIQPDLVWRATLPALRGDLGTRIATLLGFAIGATVLVGCFMGVLFEAAGAGGIVAPVAVGLGLFVCAAVYPFGWWRAADLVRGVRGLRSLAPTVFVFLMPLFAMSFIAVFLMAWLLGLSTFAGMGRLSFALSAGLIFLAGLTVILVVGVAGHAVDVLRRRDAPSFSSALLLLAVMLSAALTVVVCGLSVTHFFGLGEFGVSVTMVVAIASALFGVPALLHGMTRSRGKNHDDGSHTRGE